MTKLEKQFLRIKKQFFPRWDRAGEWKVSGKPPKHLRHSTDLHGYCDTDSKTIHVAFHDSDCLLVHEICHAVASLGHEKKWSQRMIKAAELAEQAGEQQLAQNIRKEIKSYADAPIPRVLQIENEVHDAALGNDLSFETILDFVAGGWGMTSTELLRRFPAAPRRGFNEARA